MQGNRTRGLDGVEVRHLRNCASQEGERCSCAPSYRGYAWSPRDKRVVRGEWTKDLAAAKGWRDDARSAARKGALRVPSPTTLREAGEAWLQGAREGLISNRSGQP
jgi:hypothetical protein